VQGETSSSSVLCKNARISKEVFVTFSYTGDVHWTELVWFQITSNFNRLLVPLDCLHGSLDLTGLILLISLFLVSF